MGYRLQVRLVFVDAFTGKRLTTALRATLVVTSYMVECSPRAAAVMAIGSICTVQGFHEPSVGFTLNLVFLNVTPYLLCHLLEAVFADSHMVLLEVKLVASLGSTTAP